jgi:hypothetical protein
MKLLMHLLLSLPTLLYSYPVRFSTAVPHDGSQGHGHADRRGSQGSTVIRSHCLSLWLRSAVLISRLKNTVGWFVVREKYCSNWKNKLKKTDYKLDKQAFDSSRRAVGRATKPGLWASLRATGPCHGLPGMLDVGARAEPQLVFVLAGLTINIWFLLAALTMKITHFIPASH